MRLMLASDISKHVEAMAALKRSQDRRTYLQSLIGKPVAWDDKSTLQWRALLVSALNRAGVWPARGR